MNNTVNLFFSGDFCSKPSTSKIAVSDELKSLIQHQTDQYSLKATVYGKCLELRQLWED